MFERGGQRAACGNHFSSSTAGAGNKLRPSGLAARVHPVKPLFFFKYFFFIFTYVHSLSVCLCVSVHVGACQCQTRVSELELQEAVRIWILGLKLQPSVTAARTLKW